MKLKGTYWQFFSNSMIVIYYVQWNIDVLYNTKGLIKPSKYFTFGLVKSTHYKSICDPFQSFPPMKCIWLIHSFNKSRVVQLKVMLGK